MLTSSTVFFILLIKYRLNFYQFDLERTMLTSSTVFFILLIKYRLNFYQFDLERTDFSTLFFSLFSGIKAFELLP
ncbi:hypothetical protein QE152_g4130 [Popillia japonica]|uniref:Uncharacterized protein n=1 Tax=Popillia japonica TaxID=7064 RepID=A0AAW1MY26_POPJA